MAEKILDWKVERQSKKNRRIYFLVKWKRLQDSEASWENDITLWQFEKLIKDFLNAHPMRTSNSPGGGGL